MEGRPGEGPRPAPASLEHLHEGGPRPLGVRPPGPCAPSAEAAPGRAARGAGGGVTWTRPSTRIAERLRSVVDRHGPESLVVATSQWNTQTENGAGRRFMNLLGAPNWISGVALCAGNTAAVNRMVYGWFPYPDYPRTRCIVLFGHNPRKHSWTPVYNAIRAAQRNGASSSCWTRAAPRTRSSPISGCRFAPERTPRCASAGSR